MKYLLTVFYIAFTTGGIFCMKSGGDSLQISLKNGFSINLGYITALGFVLYICSFLLWQKLIATYDLSYIVPITTGIVQVIILLFSYFIFKEHISLVNFIGIVLIIAGIILVSIKK